MEWQVDSTTAGETKRIAENLGRRLKGGEVIELISDLGGGKTTFVHGLAKGIGSSDHVASPTFTVSRVYKGEKLEMYHFDFYRLENPGLMEHELHDVLGDPHIVVVIEWGAVVTHVLPKERLTIRLMAKGEEKRRLDFTCPKSLAYIIEDLR